MWSPDLDPRPNAAARPRSFTPREARALLREELDQLNEGLRVLDSADHAVRAYVTSWLALVALAVAGKLVWDWQRLGTKPPLFAIPILAIGVGLFMKARGHRARQRACSADEEVRLSRQRELRTILGLDEAHIPPPSDAPLPALDS